MKILSIDPGMSGCAVVLDMSGDLLTYTLFPTTFIGKSKRIDIPSVAAFIRDQGDISRCFIEKVGAMPGQGVTSMFNFGHAAGALEGCVAAMGLPLTHVTPQSWKHGFGLIGCDKDAARAKVALRFPHFKDLQQKGKGQAISDAVLIAYHGMGFKL